MNKDTFEKQRAFAGEKKESMHRRMVGHDYTQPCMYLITMVTEERRPLLGKLQGRSDAPEGSSEEPRVIPSLVGKAVSEEWWGIPSHYSEIEIISFQLMPDHFHGILYVKRPLPVHLSTVLTGFKTGCNKKGRALGVLPFAATEQVPFVATESQHTGQRAEKQEPQHTGQRAEKQEPQYTGQRPHKDSHPKKGQLFEPGFNDKILMQRDQLQRWKDYLHDNPRRLLMKRERPELLRVQRDVIAAGRSYSAIGNISLLVTPWRVQVQLTRSLTPEQIEEKVEEFLNMSRQGAVLVSPKISDGEKAVLNAAFAEKFPIIVLLENGFTDVDKPKGRMRMEACSEGRLLQLAPWPHHNERTVITRKQCLELNQMCKEICEYDPYG